MTKEEQRARGQRAERLLRDELLTEVMDKMEASVLEMWKTTDDKDARERLWYTYQGHKTFKEALTLLMTNGKAADKEIQNLHKQKTSIF